MRVSTKVSMRLAEESPLPVSIPIVDDTHTATSSRNIIGNGTRQDRFPVIIRHRSGSSVADWTWDFSCLSFTDAELRTSTLPVPGLLYKGMRERDKFSEWLFHRSI